jgi:hypothetical protein
LAPDKTIPNTAVIYCHILTLGKEGTIVNYSSIYITLAPSLLFAIQAGAYPSVAIIRRTSLGQAYGLVHQQYKSGAYPSGDKLRLIGTNTLAYQPPE